MTMRRVAIQTLYQGLYDGPHATPKPSEDGPVFLGIGNITEDGKLDLKDVRHIAEEDYPTWTKRVTPQPGDIVFTYEATLNRYAIVPEGFRGCLGRRTALIRPNAAAVNPRFLFFYFFSEDWRKTIGQNVLSGATVDRIPLTRLPTFPVTLPARAAQDRIASILSAYDDLIENNTRRIKILEEMAQMLYREWFVNFRFPSHEKVKIIESELGPIPKGWTVQRLGDVAGVNEISIKNSTPPDQIRYIDIASVSTARIEKKESMHFDDAPGRARRIVKHGDIIWSTVRPNRRSYALIVNPEPNLIVSTGFAVLTARSIPYSYLYFAVTTDDFADYLTNHATGSAYPAVNSKDFENAKLLIASESVRGRFHEITADMLELQWSLHRRNANLRTTRDLLLPKLISGEISVEAADDVAELTEQTA
jgi:type I restriction enzyme S subunit